MDASGSEQRRVDLPAAGATLDDFGSGTTTVEAVAYAGTTVVGRQQVAIELTGR